MDLHQLVNSAFEAYRDLQQTHPLLGAILTAGIVYPIGDITSQLLTDKKIDWIKVRFTATLSPLYGAGIYGLMETGNLVGDHISEEPLAKAALGPNFLGNLYNTFFFVNNTVGERTRYRLKDLVNNYSAIFRDRRLGTIWKNFKERYVKNIPGKEYLNSVIGTLTAWNVFQYCNYAYISDEMQTPAALGAGFVWTSFLSLWSLRGRRKIVEKEKSL